ncbi:MAG: hypothetical protein EXR73_05525 [Myxococcales bacterium]|nr:hypothetical protein [Myxococcales bacterium]
MSNKSPLNIVKAEHGDKSKLVDKVMGLVERGEEETDALRSRLQTASNKQLLRLLGVAKTVKEQYGTSAKLAASVAAALGRTKDADYVRKLESYTPAKLLDMAQSLAKRARGTATKVAAKAAPVAKAAAKVVKAAAKPAAKPARAKS